MMLSTAELMSLSGAIDDAQAYFVAVAGNHDGQITLTFSTESPRVTVFLGTGPDTPIGMGDSVAGAIADALGLRDPVEILKMRVKEILSQEKPSL